MRSVSLRGIVIPSLLPLILLVAVLGAPPGDDPLDLSLDVRTVEPESVCTGAELTVSFSVDASGGSPTGEVAVRFILSEDLSVGDDGDIELVPDAMVSPEAVGDDLEHRLRVPPATPPGAYRVLGMLVDVADASPSNDVDAGPEVTVGGETHDAVTAAASDAEAEWPKPAGPAMGRIVFSRHDGEDAEIFVVAEDGSELTQLTDDPADDSDPHWSPDGARIAFMSDRDGLSQIYVMDADGSDPRNISASASDDRHPAWSGDGASIAFSTGGEIWVMDADGGNRRRVTEGGEDSFPAWSDGRIVFQSQRDGDWDIWAVNPNGSGLANLSDSKKKDDLNPACSPDGDTIAFSRNGVLWLMDADGRHQRPLPGRIDGEQPAWSPDADRLVYAAPSAGLNVVSTSGADQRTITDGEDAYPCWTASGGGGADRPPVRGGDGSEEPEVPVEPPRGAEGSYSDGERIVFHRFDGSDFDIYKMDPDGGNVTALTTNPADEWDPFWSPDHTQIAFVSTRDGYYQIYVMDADGDNQHNISNTTSDDWAPSWSPDGEWIAFERADTNTIWIMKSDGTEKQSVTSGNFPAWTDDGRIVFHSNGDQIYVVNTDGTGLTNLSSSTRADRYPAVSPDGATIAFERDGDLWLMDIDGSDQRAVGTATPGIYPTWSPDGTELAYTEQGFGGISRVATDGTGWTPLTGGTDHAPCWAAPSDFIEPPNPDLGRIVFYRLVGGQRDIYKMNSDGSGLTQLTSDPADDVDPHWNPDHTKICFHSRQGSSYFQIFVMDADGGNQLNISNSSYDDRYPSWSPDGTSIAFYRNGYVWVMDSDGSNQQQVAEGAWPAWTDDGRILFQSPASEICAVNPDGTGLTFLTGGPSDYYPACSPDGGTIAFMRVDTLWLMDADGQNQRQIGTGVYGGQPTWSPDGTMLSYTRTSGGISTTTLDGSTIDDVTFSSDYCPCWAGPGHGSAPPSPDLGRIVYQGGLSDIYKMEPDGSGKTQLTTDHAGNADPHWSPDHSRIAFRSRRDGHDQVYVMNADGTDQHNISNSTNDDDTPAWSPDGDWIAFTRDNDGIWVMRSDGSDQQLVVTNGYEPAWTADGRIVFGYYGDIHIINPDGSERTALTDNGSDNHPAGSPDGYSIAFTRSGQLWTMTVDGANQQMVGSGIAAMYPTWSPNGSQFAYVDYGGCIATVNDDGTEETRITTDFDFAIAPCWAVPKSGSEPPNPDGERIVFSRNADIYKMNADGTGVTQLTTSPANDYDPHWNPDHTKICFYSDRDGNNEIYVMNADGTNQYNLSNSTSDDRYPSWSPDGESIAFCRGSTIYVMDADGENQTLLIEGRWPTWTDDGAILFWSGSYGGVCTVRPNGALLTILTNGSTDYYPACSPDGSTIALVRDSLLWTMDRDGGNQQQIGAGITGSAPTWSPDSSLVAYSRSGGGISTTTLDGGTIDDLSFGGDYTPCWAAPADEAPDSPDVGRIVFARSESGQYHIYKMNDDGSSLTRLTTTSGYDVDPHWSPDYRHIAFTSNRTGVYQIYVMDADGSDQQNISNSGSVDRGPAWSPDGNWIAFSRDDAIWIMRPDGSRQRQVVTGGYMPCWTPDGRIVYHTTSYNICTINPDGTGNTVLTTAGDDRYPACRPGGDRIAFTRANQLWTMSIDGSDERMVGSVGIPAYYPTWSPDGTLLAFWDMSGHIAVVNLYGSLIDYLTSGHTDIYPCWAVPTGAGEHAPGPNEGMIAFSRYDSGNRDIYKIEDDGAGLVRLTDHAAIDDDPHWSPDYERLAFVSDRDGTQQIYVMDGDGTGQTNLSDNAFHDTAPAWSPDGSRIAFVRSGAIMVMDADGANQQVVTDDGNNDRPAWMPDGRLTFQSDRDGDWDIWGIKLDGTGLINLTNSASNDEQPSCSMGGASISFVRDGGVWLMDADGSSQRALTSASGGAAPSWAPDDSEIALSASGLWAAPPGDTGNRQITTGDDLNPCWGTPAAATSSEPEPAEPRIVFSRSSTIWAVNADGTALQRIGPGLDPHWSPDYSQIVYMTAAYPYEICVMNADGTDAHSISQDPSALHYYPAWSLDGNWIVCYKSSRGLVLMRPDGSDGHPIGPGGYFPAWLPDGRIVFQTGSSNSNIAIVNPDGTGYMLLTNTSTDKHPAVSPDGTMIAFSRNDELWLMDTYGAGQHATGFSLYGQYPTWSPDSRTVAYRGNTGGIDALDLSGGTYGITTGSDYYPCWAFPTGECELLDVSAGKVVFDHAGSVWKMEGDGTDAVQLTWGSTCLDPHWSPDYSQIVYTSNASGRYQIWVMDADGSNQHNISNSTHDDQWPAWSPDGNWIAFVRSGSICLMRPDGRGQREVTGGSYPHFTPEGRILFASSNDIWRVDPDGSDRVNLTISTSEDLYPTVSPDGSTIAFSRDGNLWLMDADGNNQRMVGAGITGLMPSFAPEGYPYHANKLIYFGSGGLCTCDLNGGYETSLRPGYRACWTAPEGDGSMLPHPDAGRILFAGDTGFGYDIFVMNRDGSGLAQLTDDPAYDLSPCWSPDYSQIAFCSQRHGGEEIFLMDADGGNQHSISSGPGEGSPCWSPDGNWIVFDRWNGPDHWLWMMRPDGTGARPVTAARQGTTPHCLPSGRIVFEAVDADGIWAVDPDGGNLEQLTDQSDDSRPESSPDGETIAFERTGEVWLMDADGRYERELPGGDPGCDPTWSPAGGELAYWSSGIRRIGIDGTAATQLTHDPHDVEPSWNAVTGSAELMPPTNSGRIVYSRWQGSQFDIYMMEPDGTGVTQITSDMDDERDPHWSPDYSKIVFTSKRYYPPAVCDQIHVMNADGSGERNISNSGAEDRYPAWSPDGNWIAFCRDGVLWLMEADGSNQHQVGSGITGYCPAWLSDGRILLQASLDGDSDIWAVKPDGTDLTNLSNSGVWDRYPFCSPDGSTIAFARDGAIWLMDVDGSNQRPLGLYGSVFTFTGWSPDGSQVLVGADGGGIAVAQSDGSGTLQWIGDPVDTYACWAVPEGDAEYAPRPGEGLVVFSSGQQLKTMNPDGSRIQEVFHLDYPLVPYDPHWAPDYSQIVYYCRDYSTLRYHVRVVDADGSNDHVVAASGTTDYFYPSWSPDGNWIAFTNGSSIFTVPADGGAVTYVGAGTKPCWLPDGTIIHVRGSQIVGLRPDTGAYFYLTSIGTNDWPSVSGDGTQIAFTRDGQLWLMDADGGNAQMVGTGITGQAPTWSADGTRLIYGNGTLYSVNIDGSGATSLTSGYYPCCAVPAGACEYLASPNEGRIVFDNGGYVFRMNADGSNVTRLTLESGLDPHWSPDYSQVVYFSWDGDRYQIYAMDADGGNQHRLSDQTADDFFPAWSPDGNTIVFKSHNALWTMDTDGSNRQQVPVSLTEPPFHPAWSADGRILFQSGNDVWAVRTDGTGLTNLTNDSSEQDRYPACSPDGSSITFTRNGNLWMMDPDGQNQRQVGAGLAGYSPTWNADSSGFAYQDGAYGISTATAAGTNATQIRAETGYRPCQGVPGGDGGGGADSHEGQIVFQGTSGIYTVDPDGSNLALVASGPTMYDPHWSPDYTRVAFFSYRDGPGQIYVMDADGTGVRNISRSEYEDRYPAWSPDGEWIAFTRTGSGIWIMAPDGTDRRQVTTTGGNDYLPCWTPQGRILFYASRDGDLDIWAVNPDGSGLENLSNSTSTDRYPSCSPDGSTIAFTRDGYLWLMDADGSNQRQMDGPIAVLYPTWSLDGTQLACTDTGGNLMRVEADGSGVTTIVTGYNYLPCWTAPPGGGSLLPGHHDGRIVFDIPVWGDIYRINSDGSGLMQLTTDAADDADPHWSPDYSKIAFASLRDGTSQIFVMDADGQNQQNLSGSGTSDWSPAWSPDGTGIAFIRNGELATMAADGSSQQAIVAGANAEDPNWLVDRRIAFSSNRDGNWDIWSVNAGGMGLTNLTSSTGRNTDPSGAPDGSAIAFSRDQVIWLMDPDGSNQRVLSGDATGLEPTWSPDCRQLAYSDIADQLMVINADGTGATVLRSGASAHPCWGMGTAPPDTTAPTILSWASAATHGSIGELACLCSEGWGESRVSGIGCLLASCSEPLDPATVTTDRVGIIGVNSGDQSSLVEAVTLEGDGSVVRIALSGVLPNPDRYTVSLSGIEDLAGNGLEGDCSIALISLHGDATGNLTVDIGDMLAVRARFGMAVDTATARYDVNCNGVIDIGDMLAVRSRYGSVPPPAP